MYEASKFNSACGSSAVKFSSFATQDVLSQDPHPPSNHGVIHRK